VIPGACKRKLYNTIAFCWQTFRRISGCSGLSLVSSGSSFSAALAAAFRALSSYPACRPTGGFRLILLFSHTDYNIEKSAPHTFLTTHRFLHIGMACHRNKKNARRKKQVIHGKIL
jgi:hypothetical protein